MSGSHAMLVVDNCVNLYVLHSVAGEKYKKNGN